MTTKFLLDSNAGRRLTVLFVATNVSNVWTITKDSPHFDLTGSTAVALSVGWFQVWKQNSSTDIKFVNPGDTLTLSGGSGTQWNILGPLL